MGEREVNKYKRELEEDKKKDEELATKIRGLQKERNRARMSTPPEKEQPAEKKRKLEENRWVKVINKKSCDSQKRGVEVEENVEETVRNLRRRVGDIRYGRRPKSLKAKKLPPGDFKFTHS